MKQALDIPLLHTATARHAATETPTTTLLQSKPPTHDAPRPPFAPLDAAHCGVLLADLRCSVGPGPGTRPRTPWQGKICRCPC